MLIRVLFFLLVLFISSCNNEPEFSAPLVQTGLVSNLSGTGFQLNGQVVLEGKSLSEIGFVWDIALAPVIGKGFQERAAGVAKGSFSIKITNEEFMLSNKIVYVRAYGKNDNQIIYGTTEKFNTGDVGPWSGEIILSGPRPRAFASSFVINGEAYYGLGSMSSNEFWKFSPASNTWTKMAAFPGGVRQNAIAFTINHIGYVGMGAGPNSPRDLWAYNPLSNSWTRKADHPSGHAEKTLCFTIGNKAYYGLEPYGTDFWEYNAETDIWKRLKDFPGIGRTGFVVFTSNNKAYVGLGLHTLAPSPTDMWEYDPTTDQWTRKNDFARTAGIVFAGSFSHDERGIAFTGNGQTWEYNMGNDTWKRKQDMPRSKFSFVSHFTINDNSYIVGGSNDSNPKSALFETYITYNWSK